MADRVGQALARHHQTTRWGQDDDLVFAHPHLGRFLQPAAVVERFKRALRDAGIREVRFHDLRHTFATQMAAAGVPLRTLQGYMGHSSYVTPEIYAGFCPDPSNGRAWAEASFASREVRPRVPVG